MYYARQGCICRNFCVFSEIDVGGGLNCVKVYRNDLFLRSCVHNAKYGQMHAAATIMAVDSQVLQFPEGGREDDFWQIIAKIYILLFLRGEPIGAL